MAVFLGEHSPKTAKIKHVVLTESSHTLGERSRPFRTRNDDQARILTV